MKHLRKTIDIKAAPQHIYDFVTQPSNFPGVWPSMVAVSNITASAKGGRNFDWVYKMAGLHFKGHSNVEDAQPGKFVRVVNEGAIPSTFIWTLQAIDGPGTRLTLDVEYTIPAAVFGKLAEALVVKLNEREMEHLLANIKEVTESTAASAGIAAHAPH